MTTKENVVERLWWKDFAQLLAPIISIQSLNRTTMCPSDVEARQCEPFTQRISFDRV